MTVSLTLELRELKYIRRGLLLLLAHNPTKGLEITKLTKGIAYAIDQLEKEG